MNTRINKKTKPIYIGLMDYKAAWDYQTVLFEKVIETKTYNRNNQGNEKLTDNYLLFCEHPHVFTLGKSGDENNLRIEKDRLHSIGASYYHINRGGDITYHGPGQIVGYPVIDLENFFTDIHQYLRLLEEAVIQTLGHYNVEAGRINGLTGVWIEAGSEKAARKICALGVKTSRWVTMHGFAFNVNTDLRYFDYIIPCGINDKAVTSLERELGKKQNLQEVQMVLLKNIGELFGMEWL